MVRMFYLNDIVHVKFNNIYLHTVLSFPYGVVKVRDKLVFENVYQYFPIAPDQ